MNSNRRQFLSRTAFDLGISGPYSTLTGGGGAWSMTGSFGAGDAGTWQLQAVVGTSTSQEISGRLTITINSLKLLYKS